MKQESNRKIYLDILRILACFLVIFNHSKGYAAYQSATTAGSAFCYMFLTMLTRINVPIFFMISGSLLISKDTDYKKIFTKYIPRIVVVLTCASFVKYIVNVRHDFSQFNIISFLYKLLQGGISSTYWYLYAYLAFLIMLPFLRRVAKSFTHLDFVVFIAIHFIFSTLLPFVNYVLLVNEKTILFFSSDFSVPLMTTKAFFYPLIGYYIDHVFDVNKLSRKEIFLLTLCTLVGILISSTFTYHQGILSGYTEDFVQTFDYLTAIFVFLIIKFIFLNYSKLVNNCGLSRFVVFISSLTFGIYLMDPILKSLEHHFDAVFSFANPVLYSFIWCVLSMCVCGTITFLIKKVPIIKRLL